MDIIKIEPEHYEFVRRLRMHPDTKSQFLEDAKITEEEQIKYMEKHGKNYFVALLYGVPIGYAGVVDNDIRICIHPTFQGKGFGKMLLTHLHIEHPLATGQIKESNAASQRLFESCGIPYTILKDEI